MKELSPRKKQILINAIDDYIKDAAPITSGGVKDKHISNVSSATLRNELNALEAMGYLKQLHTSGGRVPTTEGYRYYVSSLMEDFNVSPKQLQMVQKVLSERTGSLKDILSSVANLVSEATNYPTVILANGYDKLIIENIRIIPLLSGEALVLFKTPGGIINNSIKAVATEQQCDEASIYLSRKFKGRTIGELLSGDIIYSSLKEIESFRGIVENLIAGMKKYIGHKAIDIRSSKASNLLDENEVQSVKETKKILNLLDNEEDLCEVIGESEEDLTVTLGDENENLQGCALIKAPIVINGNTVGQMAVLGPERMDYSSIASALKIVMNELNKIK